MKIIERQEKELRDAYEETIKILHSFGVTVSELNEETVEEVMNKLWEDFSRIVSLSNAVQNLKIAAKTIHNTGVRIFRTGTQLEIQYGGKPDPLFPGQS